MYGTNAKKALLAALKEAPEVKALWARSPQLEPKAKPDTILRQLTDRLMMELWNRGFAVSARTHGDKGERSREAHDRWRAAKRLGGRTPPAA